MKHLLILNSDYGVANTIGARAMPIAKLLDNYDVICRSSPINSKNIHTMSFGKLFMQFFTFIQIYVSDKLPTNNIKNLMFDFFVLQKIKNMDLSQTKTVHFWDSLPKTYSYIKKRYSYIKIIQDEPMAYAEKLQSYKINSMKYVDLFIVPSDFVKESLLKHKINIKKIKVVPFGVDTKKFKPKKSSGFKVAFSGNVNKRKGIEYLCDAWKNFDHEGVELNIYGRVYPEARSHLKDLPNCKIHGFVKIENELPKNSVFVLPSLLEGSAKAIYEALACGLPVITTRNSGSIITDGKEGFIIPIKNSKAVLDKINLLYEDKTLRNRMSKRARKLAEKYTWEKYANEVIKTYK